MQDRIKVVIVDDEPQSIHRLQEELFGRYRLDTGLGRKEENDAKIKLVSKKKASRFFTFPVLDGYMIVPFKYYFFFLHPTKPLPSW